MEQAAQVKRLRDNLFNGTALKKINLICMKIFNQMEPS